MARPIKSGVDYFPLDTILDTKFELIEAEFGLTGFAVVVKLFQKIYGERGYYCEWTDEVALLFSHKCGGGNAVSEIVSAAVKRGIFDKDMFDKYSILTSKGIQERYFEAVNRRAHVEVEGAYLLICADNLSESVNINGVNVCRNPENVDRNTQRKGNKIKLNKSKGKESSAPCAPSPTSFPIEAYENLIGKATGAVKSDIAGFLDGGVDKKLICRLIEYAAENGKCTWAYIRAAILGNVSAGILTLEEYNKAREARARVRKEQREKTAKKRGINNYTDTNKPDYGDFTEKIFEQMLAEG